MSRVLLQRLLYSTAAATAAVAGTYALVVSPEPINTIDPITTASLRAAPESLAIPPVSEEATTLFLLTRDDQGSLCVFEATGAEQEGAAPIRVEEDCAALNPNLERAVLWRTLPSGDVRLEAEDGSVIVGFAPTETGEMISVAPRGVQFSLSRL